MNQQEFSKIIEFAIKGEEEAAEFYKRLQERSKFDAGKTMLKELEAMERHHITMLKNFQEDSIEDYIKYSIPDLKISQFMQDIPEHDNMTYQEVIIVAIKREEAANLLYSTMAAEYPDGPAKNLFMLLADEESKHKLSLETLYDDQILYEN